jgi:trans-aconitate methyltransferase
MPRYEEMLREIVRCLPDGPRYLLELGCGTGTLTELLARRYPEASLMAIDASAEMIEIARGRVPATSASFVVSLFESLKLPERSFDLIASNMSLHHIAEKGPFYRRLHDAMRPGGFPWATS